MRRLIVNADDFGLTEGVNRGILEAHQAGVVTSATLMANAAASAQAAGVPAELSLGCHVVLIDGAPLLPPAQVRTLVQANGRFRDSWAGFAAAALGGRLDPGEIAAETTAQIRRLQSLGVKLTHLDSHKHVHLFPSVLRPMLRAARECGVPAIRNPLAPLRPLAFSHLARRPRLWKRYTQVRLLRRLASSFRNMVAASGLGTTDGTFGIVVSGALDERLFEAIVGSIPDGTWELVCHPGYNDEDLQRVRTRLQASREQELRVLASPAARRAIADAGVQLISYRDLATARGSLFTFIDTSSTG